MQTLLQGDDQKAWMGSSAIRIKVLRAREGDSMLLQCGSSWTGSTGPLDVKRTMANQL